MESERQDDPARSWDGGEGNRPVSKPGSWRNDLEARGGGAGLFVEDITVFFQVADAAGYWLILGEHGNGAHLGNTQRGLGKLLHLDVAVHILVGDERGNKAAGFSRTRK